MIKFYFLQKEENNYSIAPNDLKEATNAKKELEEELKNFGEKGVGVLELWKKIEEIRKENPDLIIVINKILRQDIESNNRDNENFKRNKKET